MTAASTTPKKQIGEQEKSARSRGRPQVETAAEIDQQLLDHALHQFALRGYGATTMLDIIKAAGVSKTTVYSRYSSKDQIFRAIVSRQAERFAAAMPLDIYDASLGLAESLRRFGSYLLKTTLEGASLEVHRMLYSEARRFPELGIAMMERNKLGIARVSDLIRACAEREGIACRDPERAAEVFLLIINGWFANVMLSGQTVTEAQRSSFVEAAVETFLAGRCGW